MARNICAGRIRSRLGRAGVCRAGRGLVGLAPRLGLERFWLGMGRWCLGVGWPAGRRVVRRDCRSPADRSATTDLHSPAADRRRTSGDRPAADRGSSAASRACSSRSGGPTAIYRRAARRGTAAANCSPAAACHRRCRGANARHLRAARLCALYRSSRPGPLRTLGPHGGITASSPEALQPLERQQEYRISAIGGSPEDLSVFMVGRAVGPAAAGTRRAAAASAAAMVIGAEPIRGEEICFPEALYLPLSEASP
jgi:hypothetical protein